MVSPLKTGSHQFTVAGFHYSGSGWQKTVLLPPSPALANLENYGSTAMAPDGSLLVAVPIGGSPTLVTVFRYTPGAGWDTETAATYTSSPTTKCAVAWFATGEAVVVYFNPITEPGIEDVAIYTNGAWTSGPPLPTGYNTTSPGLATAANGDVLLTMGSDGFQYNYGVVATWLRP